MNDKIYIQQLENKYPDFLRNIIRGEPFAPFLLRGGKKKPETTDKLHTAIRFFQKHERSADTPGWMIDWKQWKTKKLGNQLWPEGISILTERDYLFLSNKEHEVFTFRSILDRLVTWNPLIRDWLAENPLLVFKQAAHWDEICATVDFFLHHEVSTFYIRSLPIPVHSKFVEQNKSIIHSLLSFLDPLRFPRDGRDFEDVVPLLRLPHLYPIRWLDSDLPLKYTAGLDILAIPYQTLLKTTWPIKEIWVLENETNLYLLPQRREALAIFAKGKALHNLKNIPFFASARIFYWGDLDEDGFEMLDQFRQHYPHTVSILMDEKTVLHHKSYIHTVPFRHNPGYDWFTAEEKAAYRFLWDVQGRLEQEKLEQLFVQQYIRDLGYRLVSATAVCAQSGCGRGAVSLQPNC